MKNLSGSNLSILNSYILLTGDLNARTRDAQDYLTDDHNKYVTLPENYPEDPFNMKRNSQDTHADINEHGKSLLHLCCSHNIHIVNGRVTGDLEGHLTCFTHNGASLVDYTLASSSLFPSIVHFEIGVQDQFTHLPQTFTVTNPTKNSNCTIHDQQNVNINVPSQRHLKCKGNSEKAKKNQSIKKKRYHWNDSFPQLIAQSPDIVIITEMLQHNDVDGAVEVFTTMVQNASKECKPSRNKNTKRNNAKWWDSEMDTSKQYKLKCLRFLRTENSTYALTKYRNIRTFYKAKIK